MGRPCLNPDDPHCPPSAPNHHSRQVGSRRSAREGLLSGSPSSVPGTGESIWALCSARRALDVVTLSPPTVLDTECSVLRPFFRGTLQGPSESFSKPERLGFIEIRLVRTGKLRKGSEARMSFLVS